MLKKSHFVFFFACIFLILGAFFNSRVTHSAPGNFVQINSFKTHSRFSVKLDHGFNIDLKSDKTGFEIFLPNVCFLDLGAPLGEERKWASSYEGISDKRLKSVKLSESREGLKITGVWNYPVGSEEFAYPDMETFDFKDKTAGIYFIDFWWKKGPTLLQVKENNKKKKQKVAIDDAKEKAAKRLQRRIARLKLKKYKEDAGRFCRQIWQDDTDVFLPFRPVHEKFDFSKWFPMNRPDSNFPYFEPSSKSKEATYVRLALNLYRQGKPALVVRTLEFFENEFPNSPFRHEMNFLRANALIKLGLYDQAMPYFSKIVIDGKDTPVALHVRMYLAGTSIESKQYLLAIEHFSWLIANYPKHRLKWVFHLGAAEGLYAIKHTNRAAKEYQWVIENALRVDERVEAALRIGDLYLDRREYAQALAVYFRSVKRFESDLSRYPGFFLNRAETLYWLGEYERSEKEFHEFLKKYPNYPAGWRATFRLAEIYGRQAGKDSREKTQKWLYETVNRFPFSPGATLARARLVPCGDHGGFDQTAALKFFEDEMKNFSDREDAKQSIILTEYRDYHDLQKILSLMMLDQEEKGVSVSLEILNERPNSKAAKIVGEMVLQLFGQAIVKLIREDKKYDALVFFEKKEKLLPQRKLWPNPEFMLKLSRAAADTGLPVLSKSLLSKFQRASDAIDASRSIAAEDDISKFEKKLKDSEFNFTKAKGLWIKSGMGDEEQIKEFLDKVIEESPFSYEKELILGLIEDKKNNVEGALKHAILAQSLSHGDYVNDLRVLAWTAGLQTKNKAFDAALESYKRIDEIIKNKSQTKIKDDALALSEQVGIPDFPDDNKRVVLQIDIYEIQKNYEDGVKFIEEKIAKGIKDNNILYQYATMLGKTNNYENEKKARAVFAEIVKSKKDDFWKKLAQEVLADIQITKQVEESL